MTMRSLYRSPDRATSASPPRRSSIFQRHQSIPKGKRRSASKVSPSNRRHTSSHLPLVAHRAIAPPRNPVQHPRSPDCQRNWMHIRKLSHAKQHKRTLASRCAFPLNCQHCSIFGSTCFIFYRLYRPPHCSSYSKNQIVTSTTLALSSPQPSPASLACTRVCALLGPGILHRP